jgi:hypothetical protein
MSLYKEKKFNFNLKNKKPVLISISIFILIIIIYFIVSSIDFNLTNNNNINVKFNNNPLILNKNKNLEIEVTVKNNSQQDAKNSVLEINPVEDIFEIDCYNNNLNLEQKNKVHIPILAKDNKRIIYCSVIPKVNINSILEGTYSFDIKFTLNESGNFLPTINEKRAILEIKK